MIAAASQLDRDSEDVWSGLVKAQRRDLCELSASAYSPVAAAISTVGGHSTQLG